MKAQHDLYRNLHTHTWSQVDRSTGLVASHPLEALILDASFVVQPAGNAKVRKDKRKHVHAYVRGRSFSEHLPNTLEDIGDGWQRITYNPYKHTTFVLAEGEIPVSTAKAVVLKADGTAWALSAVPLVAAP